MRAIRLQSSHVMRSNSVVVSTLISSFISLTAPIAAFGGGPYVGGGGCTARGWNEEEERLQALDPIEPMNGANGL